MSPGGRLTSSFAFSFFHNWKQLLAEQLKIISISLAAKAVIENIR
jgi:hypothetical protein